MSLLTRAATLVGLAAGGAAAARAVAALTPAERAVLADLLGAGADLARQEVPRLGARLVGMASVAGQAGSSAESEAGATASAGGAPADARPPAGPSRGVSHPPVGSLAVGAGPHAGERYRAGPLSEDIAGEALPAGARGPHGEPPADQAKQRFAIASTAFERRFALALDTEQLRKNLLYYQRTWRRQRDAAIEELRPSGGSDPSLVLDPESVTTVPTPTEARRTTDVGRYGILPAHEEEDVDFELLRHRLAEIKDDIVRNLDRHVAEFERNAAANGVQVYRARDAADANRYVIEVARRRNAHVVIKSKSMVSEEIHLNHALEEAGLHPVETDFGEWIAQLDLDRPGHMVSPIAHKNRYEVGAVVSAGTGVPTTGEDIPEMAQIARRHLRKDFLAGDIGVSGANALIASTGSIMLVTNEGNARLVTSLPPVHIAICGAEKLVPNLAAAMLQVRLLARTATGQTQTVYTTFKNGPDRPDSEMHVVLIDNGRAKMRQDPEFDAALRCIRCGACANVCPPFGVLGGHTFGYIYAGAIGLVTTPFHHGLENDADAQGLCLQCNACATVCPVEIPLPRQILDVRRRVVDATGLAPVKRAMLAVWREPAMFDRFARLGAMLAAPFATDHPLHGRLLTRLPLAPAQAWRTPPAPALKPAREVLRIPEPAHDGPLASSGARGLTVAYFVQCLTDRLFPEMAQATVDVLAACGARVVVPEGQHCCGLVADDAGDRAGAKALAKQTIVALEHVAAHWIVTGGTSCAIAVLHDFPHILADEPEWQERARRLAGRTLDFTSFLFRVARPADGALARGHDHPVTYHNFCGANNVLKLHAEPRHIITSVLGLELREMEEAGVCCGFGGSFALDHPRVSQLVAERKLANADATGAPVIVTDNPGCIAHLRGALHASGRPTRVLHMAELVAERLREVTS